MEKAGVEVCARPGAICRLLPSGGFKSFDGLEDWVRTAGIYTLAVSAPSTWVPFTMIAQLGSLTSEPAVIITLGGDLKVEVKRDLTTLVSNEIIFLLII